MYATAILRYEGMAQDRFDRDYYCTKHMPRVAIEWDAFGLIDARAFFPAVPENKKGTVCICECTFKDEACMKAAFAAPCTQELIADIPNFTDLDMTPSLLVPFRN